MRVERERERERERENERGNNDDREIKQTVDLLKEGEVEWEVSLIE